jgi:predicted DNA-binding WGR domain protein
MPAADAQPERQPSRPFDLEPGARRAYFEYVGGASSKFYAVTLEEADDDSWTVRFNFGRIGYPRAWAARIEGAPWRKASAAYRALVDEKQGKGYEPRVWPAYLKLPDGATLGPEDAKEAGGAENQTLFRAQRLGSLPPEIGGSVAGVALPDGRRYSPEPEAGSRGEGPVIWASAAPVGNVAQTWSRLAASFHETGIWPLVIDATYGFRGFDDYLIDTPRGRHTEVATILRRGWNGSVNFDEEYPDEQVAPFEKQFPGLAERTPGPRADSIDPIVASLEGHLGLVAVHRPADVLDAIGWMGAANDDGDPLDMSTVLRSWEVRFDAYLVGLGTDTLSLAVGRPARDLASATAIAAEHLAFCPDNIEQGVGSIREYAPTLVNLSRWDFWWD